MGRNETNTQKLKENEKLKMILFKVSTNSKLISALAFILLLMLVNPTAAPPPLKVTVLHPNGGEKCTIDYLQLIAWSYSKPPQTPVNVTISYSTSGSDGSYIPIDQVIDPDGATTNYTWTVPDTPSDNCYMKIEIQDAGGTQKSDTSDSAFSIRTYNDELEELSTHVAIGAVQNITVQWNREETYIMTYIALSVEQYLKGNGPPSITIETLGGTLDGLVCGISGEARFSLGERVKVFLVKEGSKFVVVRGAHGKSTLDSGESDTSESEIGYKHWFTDLGAFKYWELSSMPIQYYINEHGTPDCEGEFEAVQQGFQTWEDEVPSFLDFEYLGTTSTVPDVTATDGVNVVGWKQSQPYKSVAYVRCWAVEETGVCFEFDIIFNDDKDWSLNPNYWDWEFDVQGIATHEAGHVVGLDDLYSPLNKRETMYGYGGAGETDDRTLETGDIAGTRYIYYSTNPRNGGTFLDKPYDGEFIDGWADWAATHNEDADAPTGTLKFWADSGELYQGAWALASVSKTYTLDHTLDYPKILYAVHIRAGVMERIEYSTFGIQAFCKIYKSNGDVVAEDWGSIPLTDPLVERWDEENGITCSFEFTGPSMLWAPPYESYYTFEVGVKAEVGDGGRLNGWDAPDFAPSEVLWIGIFQEVYEVTIKSAWTTGEEIDGLEHRIKVYEEPCNFIDYTPVTWTLHKGTHQLLMPAYIIEPDGIHSFRYWSNGETSSRTDIYIDDDMTIIGYYDVNPNP